MAKELELKVEAPNNSHNWHAIVVTEQTFRRLGKWASVARTLNESIRLLEGLEETTEDHTVQEHVRANVDELKDLVQALDDCNSACKREAFKQAQPPKPAYREDPQEDDDIYTIHDFKESVELGLFIDDDGFGHPMKDGKINPDFNVQPSAVENIPEDATHVVWYNK